MDEINIYTVKDVKGGLFDTPFFAATDLMAKRKFMLLAKQDETILSNFVDDFELHKIATFNYVTGECFGMLELVMEGKQIAKEEKQ